MFKMKGLVLLLPLFLGVLAGCNGAENKEASLVSISVTPATVAIALDTDLQFVATGIYSDNTTRDLTASVEWSSTETGVAVISTGTGTSPTVSGFTSTATSAAPGHAYAHGEGTTTITATAEKISGSAELKVNRSALVSISVSPTNPGIARGTDQQFTATGAFEDNTTQDLTALVKWTSSNTPVAFISNTTGSQGLTKSLTAGITTITAAWGNITGTTILTVNSATLVSIEVTPTNPTIARGTNQQFTAIGTYSDNTTQNLTSTVTWSSSNTAIATVSNALGTKGLAASITAGTATITATSGSISGTTTLTANPATLVSITITPIDPGIAKGTRQQFAATGTYSDQTTQNITASATWTSSNTAVATISNAAGSKGLATSVAAGSTTIKATSGSISGSTSLTVNPASLLSISVTPSDSVIPRGTSQQFTATGTYSDSSTQNLTNAVTWSSSNTGIATVSNAAGSNGQATSTGIGSTVIKAISGSIAGTAGLTVADGSLTLAWDAPITNTDGSSLTDIAGYKIHYGNTAGHYTKTLSVGNVTSYAINNLVPGTYYFTVTAYNTSGSESSFSNEAAKTIQ